MLSAVDASEVTSGGALAGASAKGALFLEQSNDPMLFETELVGAEGWDPADGKDLVVTVPKGYSEATGNTLTLKCTFKSLPVRSAGQAARGGRGFLGQRHLWPGRRAQAPRNGGALPASQRWRASRLAPLWRASRLAPLWRMHPHRALPASPSLAPSVRFGAAAAPALGSRIGLRPVSTPRPLARTCPGHPQGVKRTYGGVLVLKEGQDPLEACLGHIALWQFTDKSLGQDQFYILVSERSPLPLPPWPRRSRASSAALSAQPGEAAEARAGSCARRLHRRPASR